MTSSSACSRIPTCCARGPRSARTGLLLSDTPETGTALHLLSDFAATTPAAVVTHIADELRTRRDSHEHIAQLPAQNDELGMQSRHAQMQMQPATQPITPPPASSKQTAPSQTQHGPTALSIVLALLIECSRA